MVLIERAGLLRDEQIALVRQIAAAIGEREHMVNDVLRVSEDGTFAFAKVPTNS